MYRKVASWFARVILMMRPALGYGEADAKKRGMSWISVLSIQLRA